MFENEEGDPVAEGTTASNDAGTETTTDTPTEWDGAWDSLDKQPWWSTVPETARGHFQKYHEERDALNRLLDADDATAELRKGLSAKESELEGLKKSLGEHTEKLTAAEKRAQAAEDRLRDMEHDAEFSRLEKEYPDIFADVHYTDEAKTEIDATKGAFPKFVSLVSKGVDPAEAAVMARAFLPQKPPEVVVKEVPPKTRDVTPPPAVTAATPGGNNPASTAGMKKGESFADAVARMEREAGKT